MSIFILPYRTGSQSARELKDVIGAKIIRLKNSKYSYKPGHTVLNWGQCNLPGYVQPESVINPAHAVASAANKLTSMKLFRDAGIRIPDFTEDINDAKDWAKDSVVFCRTLLRGHGGAGIVIANNPDEVVNAKLYTRYVKKQDEYRVHICRGTIFDVQRKMRKRDVPDEQVDWKIRNHANGFIFGRGDVDAPDDVLTQSLAAVAALGLDFGAVDVVWNEYLQQAFVLEVNTAPGVTGTTLEKYGQELRRLIDERG